MNHNEKYYLQEIFEKFIQPNFSIVDYIIFFEWDNITRNYRYVVTPKENKNKFISFYLHKHDKIDDFKMVVIYTSVGEFNSHNTQKLLFLIAHDDLERFNHFYQDFIDDLNEKSFKESPFDFYIPFFVKSGKKE
ncbi:hypothetical protein [Maribellus maritimus]|uniref:hypothetical protein n=1 Tax=Maribellus maritimus TaxID=2870838 RepID=UPI001EEA2806|nr:hypothetical protein [Maribellus maritimus]MCG6191533.1 hypothetical protein [Maribellus maritimus]